MVHHHLRPHQVEILNTILSNRQTAILGARQSVGKTTAVAYAALCMALGVVWRGQRIPPHDVQVVSRSQKHSQEIVRRINRMLGAFAVGVSQSRARADTLANPDLGSMERIALANGREIRAHAGDPAAIQGLTGSIIVDEIAANRHNPAEMLGQALPLTLAKEYYRIVLIGNASVRGDWWHAFWEGDKLDERERREQWALGRYTVHDAFPNGILPPHVEHLKRTQPEHHWRRWMLCEFLDAFNRAVPDEQLDAAQSGTARTPVGALTVLCVDPGGHFNPTGLVAVRAGGMAMDVLRAEYLYGPTVRKLDADESWLRAQLERVDQWVREFRPVKIIVDQSEFASALGKALRSKFGSMVELTPTTEISQQRQWSTMQSLLRDGRMSIPAGEAGAEIRGDLARLELDESARRFEAGKIVLPSTTAENGTHVLHCDLAAAAMLGTEFVHLGTGDAVELPTAPPMPKPSTLSEPMGLDVAPKRVAKPSLAMPWD